MVKMELPSSKSQASSVKSIGSDLKSKIAAFQSALSGVSGIASFKGVAASKAKEYAESNMRMIAESANDLVDGVVKSVSQLPSEYTGQVDSKSHDSEKLQQSINQLQQQQSTLNSALDAANKLSDSNSSKGSMIGNIKGLQSANSAKLKKQQELLQKLLQFDSNSPRYFDDIDSLFSAFEQAADNVKLDYNASSGSYGSFKVSSSSSKSKEKSKKSKAPSGSEVSEAVYDGRTTYTEKKGENKVHKGWRDQRGYDGDLPSRKAEGEIAEGERLGTCAKVAEGIGFGWGMYNDVHNDHKSMGEALTHNAASVIATDAGVFAVGMITEAALPAAIVAGVVSFGFNYMYDHNIGGLQTKLDKAGKELDKAGKAISKKQMKGESPYVFE